MLISSLLSCHLCKGTNSIIQILGFYNFMMYLSEWDIVSPYFLLLTLQCDLEASAIIEH